MLCFNRLACGWAREPLRTSFMCNAVPSRDSYSSSCISFLVMRTAVVRCRRHWRPASAW